jgi:CO/xanthine dehydrogenase Mo-binding subunit
VAGTTRDAAEAGAALIRVEHEVLPSVLTVAAALGPLAPLVQEPALRPGDPLAGTNILRERSYGWGDISAVRPDLVLENDYTFPMVTHFAIEPHGAIAAADGDGLTLWSPVQHPYLLQRMMADLFQLPLTKVRVFAPDPGGGFGGKQNPKFEPLLAFLAMRTGRPCRLVLTLEETFQAVRRTAAQVRVPRRSWMAGRYDLVLCPACVCRELSPLSLCGWRLRTV